MSLQQPRYPASFFLVGIKVTANPKKSGSGTDQLYKSKWRFYERLNFLDGHISPLQTFSNFNVGKAADGSETEEVAAAKPPKTEKLTKDTEVDPTVLMKRAVDYMKTISVDEENEKSDAEVFADVMVRLLRKIPNGFEKEALKLGLQQLILNSYQKLHYSFYQISFNKQGEISTNTSSTLRSPSTTGYTPQHILATQALHLQVILHE